MGKKRRKSSRVTSTPSLIAWLSLCMLTASLGQSLDARWQTIWAEMGAFGLIAAVGLRSVERNRQARLQRSRDRALQTRLECGLTRLVQHSDTIDSIDDAVRKLARQAAVDMRGKLGKAQRIRRREQMEMVADYPLEIVPIDKRVETDSELPSISGVLQQVSSRVVSFEHAEPIPTQAILLNFQLDETRLSFVVDVTWMQKIDGVYFSGGTVLAVGVPKAERDDAVVAAAPVFC
jgi:hypothetical protein